MGVAARERVLDRADMAPIHFLLRARLNFVGKHLKAQARVLGWIEAPTMAPE